MAADRLMIDPSLLLHRATFPAIRDAAKDRLPLYVSTTIVNAVMEPTTANRRGLVQFVERPSDLANLAQVAGVLRRANVRSYEGGPVPGIEVGRSDFLELVGNQFVASVLVDEWSFLLTESWLVARTKKVISAFIDAGAAGLEISEKTFDKLVARTLKKDTPAGLTKGQRIRGVSKWIAAGGSPATILLGPLGVIPAGAIAVFLMVDPS